jgi:hypothetical protein
MYGVATPTAAVSVSPYAAAAQKVAALAKDAAVEAAPSHGDSIQRSTPAQEDVAPSSSASGNQTAVPAAEEVVSSLSTSDRPGVSPDSSMHAAALANNAIGASAETVAATQTQDNTVLVPRQCGVGVYLRQAQEGFIEVKATEPGCSADELLFEGDIMSAIDGTACAGLSLRDITRLIVGEEGSLVTITVIRQMLLSSASARTFMKEVPVKLTRRPLPQQRSTRAIKALSESQMQTPRGAASDREHVLNSADNPAASLHRSNSLPDRREIVGLPDLPSDSTVSVHVPDAKADVIMRQFLVSNTGSMPLKLAVYDRDDVIRVNEVVSPFSQYPLEQNT